MANENDYIGDLNFNDPTLTPQAGGAFEAIPPGVDYVVQILEAEKKPNKAGDGMNIEIQYEVLGKLDAGTFSETGAGSQTRAWMSLKNSKFTRGRLLTVLKAAGVQFDRNGGFSYKQLVGAQYLVDIEGGQYQSGLNPDGTPVMKQSTGVCNERALSDADVALIQGGQTAAAPVGAAITAVAPAAPTTPPPPINNTAPAQRAQRLTRVTTPPRS